MHSTTFPADESIKLVVHTKKSKVALKKQAVKTVRTRNPVFNESNIFFHIKLYRLERTDLMNYPEAVSKNVYVTFSSHSKYD